jgi:hypothetical protein
MRDLPAASPASALSVAPSLAPLARAIRAMGHQFSLHFVRAPLTARTALATELEKLRNDPSVPMFGFTTRRDRGAGFVSHILDNEIQMDGIVLLDGEALLDLDAEPLQSLNLARDRLGIQCHGPLVIACAPEAMRQIAQFAPDLYSVRSTVTDFGNDNESLLEPAMPNTRIAPTEALRNEWNALRERATTATPEFVVDLELDIARRARNSALRSADAPALSAFALDVLAHAKARAQAIGYERAAIDATVLESMLVPASRANEQTIRQAIQRLAELGAAQSEANAWVALAQVMQSSAPHEAELAITQHALPIFIRSHHWYFARKLLLQHSQLVLGRDGPRKALAFVDQVCAEHLARFPPLDRSHIEIARSALNQLVGQLDESITHALSARTAATESADSTVLALALHREIVARGARRSALDRSVVSQLLLRYRDARAASPMLDESTLGPSLEAALTRLDLVSVERKPAALARAPDAPRNRAERQNQRW